MNQEFHLNHQGMRVTLNPGEAGQYYYEYARPMDEEIPHFIARMCELIQAQYQPVVSTQACLCLQCGALHPSRAGAGEVGYCPECEPEQCDAEEAQRQADQAFIRAANRDSVSDDAPEAAGCDCREPKHAGDCIYFQH